MRLTSEFWVSAYIRAAQAAGDFAVLRKRGATEAGAIFIIVDDMKGNVSLFGPAPQAGLDDVSDRTFECLLEASDPLTINDRLEKEKRFDPDFWVVEREAHSGNHGLRV